MNSLIRKKIAAAIVVAAMSVAIIPSAALASAPAPDPGAAVAESLVDDATRKTLTDLYDSASALLAAHGDELAGDVRIYLETIRSQAYDVLMYGGYQGHAESTSNMRVALAIAEANLAGTTANTNAMPDFVIGSSAYNETHPLLVSANMANTIATIYATNRNLPPEMIRVQVLNSFVERIYSTALGRTADTAGRDYWVNGIISGELSADDYAISILNSAEFQGRNLSDEAYVTALYKTFFDRNPDTAGLNNWVTALQSGASRADIVSAFTQSAEWNNICSYYGL
ncbi:MAG: DUF4214 domain-containing protein [Saccharofermentans sp.]|nr:DUF4214 domain-containing protein [Saccharofermentans sp.]